MSSLAVLTATVGVPSETFIHRHITALAPGRTLVVTLDVPPSAQTWTAESPVHRLRDPLPWRVLRRGILRRSPSNRQLNPPPRLPSRSAKRDLESTLRSHGISVVLAEYLDKWVPFVDSVLASGARLVAHAHGYDVSRALRGGWEERYLTYAQASGIVTVSHYSRDRLIEIGLPGSLIHVVPCSVPVPSTPPDPPPSPPIRCVAVGRLVAKKAPHVTLEAFAIAARQMRPGELTLDVVGGGPMMESTRALAKQLGIAHLVTFHGAQPPSVVQALLANSHMFLQHSVTADDGDQEGMPVAILEAMAAGRAVISTRHAGIPEAVLDGTTGVLVDELDVDSMAVAIQRLAESPQQRIELGLAGWNRARRFFSVEKEISALRGVLGV